MVTQIPDIDTATATIQVIGESLLHTALREFLEFDGYSIVNHHADLAIVMGKIPPGWPPAAKLLVLVTKFPQSQAFWRDGNVFYAHWQYRMQDLLDAVKQALDAKLQPTARIE